MQIMLKKDDKETGLFTREEVSAMLADGRINMTYLAFCAGTPPVDCPTSAAWGDGEQMLIPFAESFACVAPGMELPPG